MRVRSLVDTVKAHDPAGYALHRAIDLGYPIEMVRAELLRGLRAHGMKPEELAGHARRITARQEDPFATAAEMVKAITGGSSHEQTE